MARELVSKIQQMRKKERYAVSDRVRVDLDGGPELAAVVQEYESYIAGEVLATEVTVAGGFAGTPDAVQTIELDCRVGSHCLDESELAMPSSTGAKKRSRWRRRRWRTSKSVCSMSASAS